ncbi:hypothetical protein Taro_039113 [Colocasia esculenta]|uniref:Uncharacterized protein n=1 Tax=Colocasia esculenta TaxID=4460 RepID=A0A843WFP5_COLES|nr:hypothetical protein [Colocasia esculenta]
MDTNCRYWSPTSPFPVPHSRVLRPETLEVPGMGLRLFTGVANPFTWLVCGGLYCSSYTLLGEFPTKPVTREAHPYPYPYRLRPVRGRWTRIKFVNGLTGLNEAFRHSWYQNKFRKFEMADRRDWGGGGEDPEKSTQRMIERIWESLTDIRVRMEKQAPVPPAVVPPVTEVSVAPVAPPPRVEGLREELQNAVIPFMCRSVEEAAQRAATLERSIRARQASGSGSDPVLSSCDGYREANVVCVWYVCEFQGLIGPIVWACSTPVSSVCHCDRKECRVLNVTEVAGAFLLPLCGFDRLHVRHVSRARRPADVSLGKATPSEFCSARRRGAAVIFAGIRVFDVLVTWEARMEREKCWGSVIPRVLRESPRVWTYGSWHPRRNAGGARPLQSGEVSCPTTPVFDVPTGPYVTGRVILHVAPVVLEWRETVDEMTLHAAPMAGELSGPAGSCRHGSSRNIAGGISGGDDDVDRGGLCRMSPQATVETSLPCCRGSSERNVHEPWLMSFP